jgi:hypothetical protein
MIGMNSHDDARAPEHDDKRAPEYKDADRQARNQQADGRTIVPATRARQAVGGHNARYVLVFGLAAVIGIFGAIYLIYFT